MPGIDDVVDRARLGRYVGLQALVLFGFRARGDAHEQSDWDVGYLAAPGFDSDALLADVVRGVDSEQVDLVDLDRAGGQIRFRAARDGRVLFEVRAGVFARFWVDAVTFWCDAAPILQGGYEQVLSRLSR